ncbi:hypothetical protein [Nonomuraea helvata]|uniref:hypothetical protein n=1 Tax=Nonomuraea helvata TaxID=37484 RepID=UPI0031F15A92
MGQPQPEQQVAGAVPVGGVGRGDHDHHLNKSNIVVDTLGLLLAVLVTAAGISDSAAGLLLLTQIAAAQPTTPKPGPTAPTAPPSSTAPPPSASTSKSSAATLPPRVSPS